MIGPAPRAFATAGGPRQARNLRVLHLIPGFDASYGGASYAAVGLCRALNEAGVAAEIATTDAFGKREQAAPLDVSGITAHVFHSPWLHKYGFSPALLRWLRQHGESFDLLHVHSLFSASTGSICRYARLHDLPYILRPVGQLSPWALAQNRVLKRLYLAAIGRRCLEGAATLHLTSAGELESVRALGVRAPTLVIPECFEPGEARRAEAGRFKARNGLAPDTPLVVFLARFHPVKGLDLLIPALRALADRSEFVAVLAGSGSAAYEREIRALVDTHGLAGRVRFTGFLEGAAKWELLRDSAVFVLPSYSENFGLAAVEAMALGVPVVLTRHVGIHTEVSAAGAGIVTDSRVQEIADALAQLLGDETLRHGMGERASRLVDERFSYAHVADRLIALYRSLVVEPGAREMDAQA